MRKGSVFENNRTQAVRLPAETRFPDDVACERSSERKGSYPVPGREYMGLVLFV